MGVRDELYEEEEEGGREGEGEGRLLVFCCRHVYHVRCLDGVVGGEEGGVECVVCRGRGKG